MPPPPAPRASDVRALPFQVGPSRERELGLPWAFRTLVTASAFGDPRGEHGLRSGGCPGQDPHQAV